MRSFFVSDHSSILAAFDDVTVAPPFLPTNPFIAAVELTYVNGIIVSPNSFCISIQPRSVCLMSAMSASEQPALISGSITVRSEEHTSELQSRGHLVCRLL